VAGRKRIQKALEVLDAAPTPLDALAAAREVRHAAEEVERELAAEARAAGVSWTKIGALYGTSKQNAQQRFGVRKSPPE
jgi:hypothetical protein